MSDTSKEQELEPTEEAAAPDPDIAKEDESLNVEAEEEKQPAKQRGG